MSTVLLVIHLMVAAVLVGLVLLQRSEGGALGIGGGGGGGGFMTGRGTANLLTRVTAVVAALFFVTSIMLTILARQRTAPSSILDEMPAGQTQGQGGGILDDMQPGQPGEQQEQAPAPPRQEPGTPQVPQSQ